MIKEKEKKEYERKNIYIEKEIVEVLDFFVYKKKKSLKEAVNHLLKEALTIEFKEDPHILSKLDETEYVDEEEQKEIEAMLASLTEEDKKPTLLRYYDENSKQWVEQEL